MKMERCTAAILLMLSLEALVAGRLSAAVAADGVDTIRLPSHGLADELATAARESGGEKKRPWKCCDVMQCNRMMPPGCRCMDAVERCDDACRRCVAHPSHPSKLICMDRYTGFDSGPACTDHDGEDVPNGIAAGQPGVAEAAAEAVSEESVVVDSVEAARPWKCCDHTLCTRSAPPTCQCLDKVKRCAKTCKVCQKAGPYSLLYVCRDRFYGWPGPKCYKSVADGDRLGIAAGQPGVAEAVAEAVSEESVVVDDVEAARPWKCCDHTLCTRSAPPTCQCLDKVKRCAKTCKVCQKAGPYSLLYVCRDRFYGWPGPKCYKSVADGDRLGIAAGQPGVAEAVAEAVSEESVVVDDVEAARPWKCCDHTLCTRSAPPTCQCLDKVKRCAKTCKVCQKAGPYSLLYVCRDRFYGWPGPKCYKSVADGDRLGIAAGQPGVAEAATEAVSEESVVVDDVEAARPWKCCDDTLCTRSAPPTCQCLDKVKRCAKTCKVCQKAGPYSLLYVCRDRYYGWPGPKCYKSVAGSDRPGN